MARSAKIPTSIWRFFHQLFNNSRLDVASAVEEGALNVGDRFSINRIELQSEGLGNHVPIPRSEVVARSVESV
jgi:hypothetical protein